MGSQIKANKIVIQLPKFIHEQTIVSKEGLEIEGERVERCGILVGKRDDPYLVSITDLIEDSSPLEQTPFQVYRETSHVYPQLLEAMKLNPTVDYIGEWHTHPNGPYCASLVDHYSMISMLNNLAFGNIEWVVMVVFLPNRKINGFFYRDYHVMQVNCILT